MLHHCQCFVNVVRGQCEYLHYTNDLHIIRTFIYAMIQKFLHTLPVPGATVLQIDKDLMLSFDEVSVVVLFSQTNCHLPNYAVQQT